MKNSKKTVDKLQKMDQLIYSKILEKSNHSERNSYQKALRVYERFDKTRYVYLVSYTNEWSYVYGIKLLPIEYDWLTSSLKKRERFKFFQNDGKILFIEWKSANDITIISHYLNKTCKLIYNQFTIDKLINIYSTFNHIPCNHDYIQ